jgi:myo-inositol-1-phosphate synthase
MEGKLFGDVPMNLELRLSVEDSPNSAGIVIDAIRCVKLALNRGEGGVLYPSAAYFMKHPPEQFSDDEAYRKTEEVIQGTWSPDPVTMPDYVRNGKADKVVL